MINYFDLFTVIVTLGLAVYGFHEGLLRGAIKLVGFIIVIIFLSVFSAQIVGVALTITFLSPKISIPLAYLVLLIIGTALFHIAAYVIHKLVHMTPAGFIDSGLGCAFGIIKALFLNGLVAIFISLAPSGSFFNSQYEESVTAKHLKTFLSESIPLVKKAVIPLYQRFAPLPCEPEKKQDDETIPPDFI